MKTKQMACLGAYCEERNACWNKNRLQGVTVIDLFDVVCLRCNDDDEAAVELFILRWLIIGINVIDKQHEVFYCSENVSLTTTSKENTSC